MGGGGTGKDREEGVRKEMERRQGRGRERSREIGRILLRQSTYFPVSVSHTATVLSNDPVSTASPVVLNPRQITSAE